MTKRKEEATVNIGRASFTPNEIAQRNAVSVTVVYRAIKDSKLHVTNLGQGQRGGIRITLAQEAEWLQLCSQPDEKPVVTQAH